MWDAHAEISKKTLDMTLEVITQQEIDIRRAKTLSLRRLNANHKLEDKIRRLRKRVRELEPGLYIG